MYIPPKQYRTAAFHGQETTIEKQPTLWYWTFVVPYDNPDRGTIYANEVAVSYSYSQPIQQNVSAHEAIAILTQLENDAHASGTFTPANDRNYETYKQLSSQYHECKPFHEHPTYIREQAQKKLKENAAQKSGLKLQPRKRNMGGPS